MLRVVLDTNVLVAGLRRGTGASAAILELVERRRVQPVVSVPLFLEYEAVLKRPGLVPHFTASDVDTFLDFFLSNAVEQRISFLWRPFLPDANDDLLVELALAASAFYLVTSNVRHLAPARALGLTILTPRQFLAEVPLPP